MNPIIATFTQALDLTPHAVRDLIDTYDPEPAAAAERFTQPDALTQAAHWYATNGLPIFPCQPGTKQPATAHGFKDATTNPGQVTQWWATNPAYNIATPTGYWFDVLDIDHPTIGWPNLRDDFHTGTNPAPFAAVHTPRGLHLYLPPTTDTKNATNLVPGVDYRTQGGYVLLPPSHIPLTPTYPGGRYRSALHSWPTQGQLNTYAR